MSQYDRKAATKACKQSDNRVQSKPSRTTYGGSVSDILGEQHTLELNQEKVGQLAQVFQDSLDGFLWQGVVFTGTERARKALVEDKLAGSFSSGGDYISQKLASTKSSTNQWRLTSKGDVKEFENPSQKRQIASSKNEGDNAGKRDSSSAWTFPLFIWSVYSPMEFKFGG